MHSEEMKWNDEFRKATLTVEVIGNYAFASLSSKNIV